MSPVKPFLFSLFCILAHVSIENGFAQALQVFYVNSFINNEGSL